MRLLLDCSQTYRTDLHTGIQRVVRNLINCAQSQQQWAGVPCLTVQYGRDGFRRVEEQLEYVGSAPAAPQIPHALTSLYARLRALLGKLVPLPLVRQFLFAPGADFGLTHILKTGLTVVRSPRFLLRWGRLPAQGQAVTLQPGDVVVVLEPFFSTQFWHTVAKTPDVRVVTLVHDIFPLTHPQFFSAVLVEHFREWFLHAVHRSTALMTTSQATQDSIQEYLSRHPQLTQGRRLPLEHFRPGADLDGQRGLGVVRSAVQEALSQGPDAYLCVGTLEARKNVSFVLDAFDRLWAQGVAVRLAFVGRPGWNAGAMLTRIRHHPRLGQSLLLFDDLNDAELDLAYRHARALVMASQAEGFGLPLVEALAHGLPVLASNLPVFREIGGGHARYFDLTSPSALAGAVLAFEQAPESGRSPVAFSWPDWETSTEEFLDKVLELSRLAPAAEAPQPWPAESAAAARDTVRLPPGPILTDHTILPLQLGRRLLETVGISGTLLLARKSWNLLRKDGIRIVVQRVQRYREKLAALDEAIHERPLRHFSRWLERYDLLGPEDRGAILRHIAALPTRRRISVLMALSGTGASAHVRESLRSVAEQLYPDWELCLGVSEEGRALLAGDLEPLKSDPRVKWVPLPIQASAVQGLNALLAQAGGSHVTILEPGDVLAPHALYLVADCLARWPDASLIYSDDDLINDGGERSDPHFRPAWNPDLLLSGRLLGPLTVQSAPAMRRAQGFLPQYGSASRFDLMLRLMEQAPAGTKHHLPFLLYHQRVAARAPSEADQLKAAALMRQSVQAHVRRTGIAATIIPGWQGTPRVVYALPEPAPLVTVIVATRDRADLLHTCVEGLLRQTDYPSLELIIVNNASTEWATLNYLDALRQMPRVRVLDDPSPFNFAALNNRAVPAARGDVLALVNNDIRVLAPGWLREMVSQAMRPEIGAVGAKLYYPNDTVQHAGVVLGMGGGNGHVFKHLRRSQSGYLDRLMLVQDCSALTAACLVVRKALYEEVGGLDESLAVAFNDVDFSLKLVQRGYRNLWTPYAELYHLESVTRGLDISLRQLDLYKRELEFFMARWGDRISNDPAYNPNLSLAYEAVALAFPPRVIKPWQQELPSERLSKLA